MGYADSRTYLFVLLFIAGNIALPQLCHLVLLGGKIMLPIYFFTLIGAYKYGWKTGLLTALFSPVVNNLLFGMPAADMLVMIIVKSVLLAVAAGFAASCYKRISIPVIAGVVLVSQLAGTLIEWAVVRDLFVALQDFRLGVPGMLLQVFGGYFLLKAIGRK